MLRKVFPKIRCSTRFSSTTFTPSAPHEIPSEADVVVVGGGSLGTSILYHLQARGVSAVLLERHVLTAGTTWHSAGMLWSLRPSDVEVELHAYTRRMCEELEASTGFPIWTQNGGLFIAGNAERLAEYRRLSEMGRYFGVESSIVSPAEIKEIHPLLNVDDVCGGLHSPMDGTIDPTSVVNAYSKAARQLGGKIFEGVSVEGVETEGYTTAGGEACKRVVAVHTSRGQTIKTKMVVNACGAWAPALAAMVGVTVPLMPLKHAFVVTETIPGMHCNLPNVRDHDLSIYLKTQGNAIAAGGYELNPEFLPESDPNFSFGLYDLDYDTFAQNMNGHLQRCPAMADAGIKATVCGPESFTPDHKPLVGPQPGIRGFFQACGFNSMGMMMGGGMGREVANWVVDGCPRVDLFSYDPARFHPDTVTDQRWVRDRLHESYAKTYAVVFPLDEPLAGRGARQSPLHSDLVARGCMHQSRHGFERPGWFEIGAMAGQEPKSYDYFGAYDEGAWRLGLGANGPDSIPPHAHHIYKRLHEGELTFGWPRSFTAVDAECHAARNGVALFDNSYFGKYFLRGEESFQAAQFLFGADLEGRPSGTVTYTPLLNSRGGTEADLTVTSLPDGTGFYIAAGGGTATKDLDWLRRGIDDHGFAAHVEDVSDDLAILSVQGPHSRALLQSVVTSEHRLEDMAFSTGQHVGVAGVEVLCLRLTFVGELGFELHIPAADAAAVYCTLRAAGHAYSLAHGVPVRDAGYRALDSLSAEKGYRHWHADLGPADSPLEAGIGFTVLPKLKRDVPFLGRAALEEQRKAGLQRKLVCLTVPDLDFPLHGGETMWRGDACVGFTKIAAYGHSIGEYIVYGYVACPEDLSKITNKWLESGDWSIGSQGEQHPATLHLKAPFDPTGSRIQGNYPPHLTSSEPLLEEFAAHTSQHALLKL